MILNMSVFTLSNSYRKLEDHKGPVSFSWGGSSLALEKRIFCLLAAIWLDLPYLCVQTCGTSLLESPVFGLSCGLREQSLLKACSLRPHGEPKTISLSSLSSRPKIWNIFPQAFIVFTNFEGETDMLLPVKFHPFWRAKELFFNEAILIWQWLLCLEAIFSFPPLSGVREQAVPKWGVFHMVENAGFKLHIITSKITWRY